MLGSKMGSSRLIIPKESSLYIQITWQSEMMMRKNPPHCFFFLLFFNILKMNKRLLKILTDCYPSTGGKVK